MRQILLATLACAGILLAGAPAAAQESVASYPNRPIKLIVPSGAGGILDAMGRSMAESMSKTFGQPVVVDNKAGAGATMSAITMLTARPDGYTIGIISCATLKLPHVTHATYDPLKDMTYIARLSGNILMLTVRADSPWKTLDDLVRDSKKPGAKMFFGTAGSARLFAAQLADASGVGGWTNVPYKGDADAIMALLAGDVQFIVPSNTVLPFVDSGKARVLAVFGSKKVKGYDSLPTTRELGFTTVDDCPFGVVGPKGMDPALVAKIEAALRMAIDSPVLKTTADKFGMPLDYVSSATFDREVRTGFERDRRLVEKLAIPKE